jgi:hypothetical protein
MQLWTRLGRPLATQSRSVHDSLIPAGSGGRSSWSGQSATVFGSTGTLGHSLVNNLGRIGSSVTLPVRGVTERAQVQDLRIMGDLGQLQFVQNFDMLRWSDDQVAETIRYSNVVYNLIGSYKDTNIFPRRLTNVEWAERLATLVAEKDDGTRLIHIVHLNCEDEESQKYSKILTEQAEAIDRMRSIYPETIIVKSANIVGWRDRYCHYFCMDNEWYQRTLSTIGAFPLLYGAGQNTFVSPIRKMDVARALAKIGSHPDSPGHTFELFHDEVYKLGDLVEYMYDCKWQNMDTFDRSQYKVPGLLGRKDVDLDLFMWNVLGELNAKEEDLTILQKINRKRLRIHLAKINWPRFMYGPLRFMDYIKRDQSIWTDWTNEDFFNLQNMSHKPSFKAPGFKELGVVPKPALPTIHETCAAYYPGPVHNFVPFESIDKPPSHEWEELEPDQTSPLELLN